MYETHEVIPANQPFGHATSAIQTRCFSRSDTPLQLFRLAASVVQTRCFSRSDAPLQPLPQIAPMTVAVVHCRTPSVHRCTIDRRSPPCHRSFVVVRLAPSSFAPGL
ncbi:hypothetical protein TIFTF001_016743 [Ficus carica]|uniref:Uncharacterized protein n=1 Tax=Ficus carica TaxID=3494 RepID=A0AA88AK24_FICCA|nr:hypothetical protein TIFTF001_016743 [Ficus carica]